MSSVFSMELEGISKACTTKVMMNSPVTRTAASEARNSTVVSFCFSSGLTSFLATQSVQCRAICPAISPTEKYDSSALFETNELPHTRSEKVYHLGRPRSERPPLDRAPTSKSTKADQLCSHEGQTPNSDCPSFRRDCRPSRNTGLQGQSTDRLRPAFSSPATSRLRAQAQLCRAAENHRGSC